MPELLFVGPQWKEQRFINFQIILETIYNPQLQMWGPRQKNPHRLKPGKFFPKVS